tara:strand:+ start:300 stop:614 length:315 start_codon:yes stop_codon:yes gene_type:complete
MAFGSQYPNIVSVSGTIESAEDLGPSASSGKKCYFTLLNPSLSKKRFDTYIRGYAYGANAIRMIESKGELVSVEGRVGTERSKNIVLADKVYFLDDEVPTREDE